MNRLHILQIFARYLHYGGEEGSVARIGGALRDFHDIEDFSVATQDLLDRGMTGKAMLPLLALHNPDSVRRLKKIQDEKRFDFWQIHNVFPAISPSAYSLAFKLGVPVIHYLHNYKFGCPTGFMFVKGRENRECIHGNFWPAIRDRSWHHSYFKTAVMAAAIFRARRLGIFDKVARWVAISQAQKALCVEMGIPPDRIDVVPHFLEASAHPDLPPLPTDGYGLFIGRLSEEKGLSCLIEAWAMLPRRHRLVVVGDGPALADLRIQAARLGLTNVEFKGFVSREEHHRIWAGAAFSIVPSIWQEPFGMVVLEAWAKGRPVVAHNIGALPEIVDDGRTGFLADPSQPSALAGVLLAAFNAGRERLEEMGRAGFAELAAHYSKEQWTENINGVYRRAGLIG